MPEGRGERRVANLRYHGQRRCWAWAPPFGVSICRLSGVGGTVFPLSVAVGAAVPARRAAWGCARAVLVGGVHISSSMPDQHLSSR